jgi:hypothetical protein
MIDMGLEVKGNWAGVIQSAPRIDEGRANGAETCTVASEAA